MLYYIPGDRKPKGLVQISVLSGEAEEMSSGISLTLSAPLPFSLSHSYTQVGQ